MSDTWRCALIAAGALAVFGAAAPAHARTKVTIPLPSAGDVSYGVVQVKLGKGRPSPRRPRTLAFRETLGGLRVDATTPRYKQLRKRTKIYVFSARAGGKGPKVRNVALFITRRKGAGPKRGAVTFTIANGTALKSSFWVKRVSKRGAATIFSVRNILSTAVGNWTRYLNELAASLALAAAHHPEDRGGRFAQTGAARRGKIHRGGSKLNADARAMFGLLFGTMTDAVSYQAAKRSPVVTRFISRELGNPKLAKRWKSVAERLPLAVPDTYAAAAKTEAKFVKVRRPRISQQQVVIRDTANSSQQAAIETPRLPSDQIPGRPITVAPTGTGTGTVASDVPGIACPPTCSHFFTSGSQVWLTPKPASNSTFFDWTQCTRLETAGLRRCLVRIDATKPEKATTVVPRFDLRAGQPQPNPPTTAATALDPTFGTGGFTLTPFSQQDTQLSAYGSAIATQPDGKLVVVGGRERSGPTYDWIVVRYDANGKLDPSFNGGSSQPGRLVLVESGSSGGAGAVVVRPDGRILLTGDRTGGLDVEARVYELNPDGTPTAFGGAGIGAIDVPDSVQTTGQDLALQPDGKVIVVGGRSANGGQLPFVARLNADGTPDTSFNGGSAVIVLPESACDQVATGFCEATSVFVETSGDAVTALYVGGHSFGQTPGGRVFKLVPANGQADFGLAAGYGTGGTATTPAQRLVLVQDLIGAPNGEVIIAGQSSASPVNQCGVGRLLAGGALDPSYGSGGTTTITMPQGCEAGGIARQTDGSVVFAGSTLGSGTGSGILGRVTNTGQPDTAFAPGGAAEVSSGGSPAFFNDVLLQGIKPVVAGGAMPPPHQVQVARYTGR